MPLLLRNPNSVLAALQCRPEEVLEVRLAPGKPSPKWSEVAELARQHSIPIRTNLAPVDKRQAAGKSERTGAAVALVNERSDGLVDQLFVGPIVESAGLWLALEQLQDPHNVGAIFRTAAFFGVKGIVLTRERSAPLSATVYDVASGGLEYVPFAIVPSLSRTIQLAKDAGLTVMGTSEHAELSIDQVTAEPLRLLIFGNEEHGLRRVTAESCDQLVRLASHGAVASLNVSVAAGVCMSKLTGQPAGVKRPINADE